MNDTTPRLQLDYRTPRLDEAAPDFIARTTQGIRSLKEYRGRWLMLFAHPADFTPVCTSEFLALEAARPQFEAKHCALLGLSVDSVFAHLAWLKAIKADFGVEIGFPIIEDVSLAIAAAYGMIHPGSASTATVRSVFFIDPKGILRALIHYPLTVGRCVEELLRVLTALQAVQGTELATPEGWRPGQKMVLAPPLTWDGAQQTQQQAPAWYYQEAEE